MTTIAPIKIDRNSIEKMPTKITSKATYQKMRKIIKTSALSLLACFACTLSPLDLQAQTNQQNNILILDGSGSMWGKIKDGHKVLIARRAIAKTVRDFDNKLNLGLMAYGHRRRAACNDIQLLQPSSPLSAGVMTKLVKQIKPLGKTPITGALQRASSFIRDGKNGGNIILLADGPENCRRNPCALISQEFAKSNNIRVHVIAFSMTKKDADSLRCIAKNSNGTFLTPTSEKELIEALKTAFQTSVKGGNINIADTIKPKTGKPSLKLTASLGPKSEALKQNLSWSLLKLSANNKIDKDLPPWKSTNAQPKFDLEPGSYRITTQYQDYQITKDLTLRKGDKKQENIVFNLSRLALPASWDTPNSRSGFGKLLLKSEEENKDETYRVLTLKPNSETQLIPSGAYKITAIENGNLQTWFLHAEAGKTLELPVWKSLGRVRFVMQDNTTKKPLDNPLIKIFKTSDKNQNNDEQEIARSTAKNPQFDLKSGEYLIRLTDGFASKTFPLKISSKAKQQIKLQLPRAILHVKSPTDGNQKSITIYQLAKENQTKLIGRSSDFNKNLYLNPGTYRLVITSADAGSSLSKKIKLTAGKVSTFSLKTSTTKVNFIISDKKDPLSRHQTFWRLLNKSGQTIWQSTNPEPTLSLWAGNYQILAEIGDDQYARKFSIRNGKPKSIDLSRHKITQK